MEFKNNPRFTMETNQKIRNKMAEAKQQMQKMTAGIYPESMPKQTTEVVEKPNDKSLNESHSN